MGKFSSSWYVPRSSFGSLEASLNFRIFISKIREFDIKEIMSSSMLTIGEVFQIMISISKATLCMYYLCHDPYLI